MSALIKSFYQELKRGDSNQFYKWEGALKNFFLLYTSFFVVIQAFYYFQVETLTTKHFFANIAFLSSLIITYAISRKIQRTLVLFIPPLACYFISLATFDSFYSSSLPTWFYFQAFGLFITVIFSDLRGCFIYSTLCCIFPLCISLIYPETSAINVLLEQNLIYFGVIGICASSYYQVMRAREEDKRNENAMLIKNSSDLGTWQWNLQTNEVFYDKRWLEILGYKIGELPNQLSTWEENVHPDDKLKAQEQFGSYLSGKSEEYEIKFRMKHKNEHWVPIIAKGKVLVRDSDGNPLEFGGTHFDLTNIENLEVQNEKLNYLFETVQNLSSVGGWELDIATMNTQWTDQVYHIYGLPVGSETSLQYGRNFYAPHEHEKIEKYIQNCIENGEGWDDSFQFQDAQGKEKWVRSIGEAVRNRDGSIHKLRGVFQDISGEVKMNKKLKDREAIANHNSKLASLGKLASGIGHEINNPLAIIKGYVYLIQKSLKETSEPFQENFIRINNGIERIKNIIQGVKEFSKSENDDYEILDLSEVIGSSTNLLFEVYQSKGIKFENQFNIENQILVNANRGKIQQVFLNLISNAVDATEKTTQPIIKIYSSVQEGYIKVSIEDNGTGITPEVEAKIFDPFFTTKEINTGTGTGTGISLSISHDIIQKHSGDIIYKPASNQGSVFTFSLPLAQSINRDAA